MITKCRACGGEIKEFLDLGSQPLANAFLDKTQFDLEVKYDLKVVMCLRCSLVQLLEQPPSHLMFNERYPFYTSSSEHMSRHFGETAQELNGSLNLGPASFVVEIGANDGTFLRYFASLGMVHTGVEPCYNLVERALKRDVTMFHSPFNMGAAEKILSHWGKADLIYAANTICHISYIKHVFEGVRLLLEDDGVFVFEDPYLGDILSNVSFDQIYDEHCFYFSITSVMNIAKMFGLRLKKAHRIDTHGGSMRYYIEHDDGTDPGYVVAGDVIKFNHLQAFALDACTKAGELNDILQQLKGEGLKVVGYAATSKSTTMLNFAGFDGNWIDCIYDTTPDKIGKYSPGMHIPIKDAAEFEDCDADYAVLFAYNHKDEIFAKTKGFKGKWITYVPRVEVIENDLCKQPA